MTEIVYPVIWSRAGVGTQVSMTTSRKSIKRAEQSLAPPRPQAEPGAQPDERLRREERILEAATTLLVRWGYRKTTIDDVAREAGVGKGTIYLHWKDKNELFGAALRRASRQAIDYTLRRIVDDPEGGLPHRLWTHGMLAALSNPLMAALMKGRPDIVQGLTGVFDRETLHQMGGDYAEYIVELQRAGLIRADLPVSVITFLTSALKLGVLHTPELLGREEMPSMQQLNEAISDLIRRWLEPEQPPSDSSVGKQLLVEWLEKLKAVEDALD
jgi:AcrR family transcriptional regulator